MSAPWQADAVCAALPEADLVFFPQADSTCDVWAPARVVCATCTVLDECREAVLEAEDARPENGRFGFCAGLTPTQRSRSAIPAPESHETRLARVEDQRSRKNLHNREVCAAARVAPVVTTAAIVHGTENGYTKHRLRKENACELCKAAKAKAQRNRRIKPAAA